MIDYNTKKVFNNFNYKIYEKQKNIEIIELINEKKQNKFYKNLFSFNLIKNYERKKLN